MVTTQVFTATIYKVERRPYSTNGNARFRLTLDTDRGTRETFASKTDSSVNDDVKLIVHRDIDGPLRFMLDGNHHIIEITNTDGSAL